MIRVGLAALLAALLAGCDARHDEPPALLLITLDTFRADHLGCAGNPEVRTPHLDRLARRGTTWPDAVTPIPLTTPSHASILTGTAPRTHGVLRNRSRLTDAGTTLAERLAEAGYRTAAVVSSRVVLGEELGLNRGFASYEIVEPLELPASGQGTLTAARAIERLRADGGPGSFLWVHFFDAHLPYLPPEPWPAVYGAQGTAPVLFAGGAADSLAAGAARDLRALYRGEVSFVDACAGRVVRALEETAASGAVVVCADHGEGLGEHRAYFGHDLLLYETVLHVPLIVAPAAPDVVLHATPSGVSREIARTVDVTPTLAALAGLDPAPDADGRDLVGDPEPAGDDAALVAESHPDPEKSKPIYAIRAERRKVIWRQDERRREFYDLSADPGELRDLAGSVDPEFRMLAEDLELDLRARPPRLPRTIDEERGELSEEVRSALESLGYAGGR